MVRKIISGGQTGADRAALDVAIKLGIAHGGWLPKGRKTENGPLDAKYQLQEMDTRSYAKRTEQNVIDSDGTLILSHGTLTGGSEYTRTMAVRHNRPWLHVDLNATIAFQAAQEVGSWIAENRIQILNVAGPRASTDPDIYTAAERVIETALLLSMIDPGVTDPLSTAGPRHSLPAVVDLPQTVDEAVEKLVARLSQRERSRIANMHQSQLFGLDLSLRAYIRDEFGIGSENRALFESCRRVSGKEDIDDDEVSRIIAEALWNRLHSTDRIRIVKS